MRKRKSQQREVLPDPRFQDVVVTKFVNGLMIGGKKSVAENIFYGALDLVEKKTNEDGTEIVKERYSNVKPAVVEVKSRRIGGATYQIPVEVRPKKDILFAIRWLRDYARLTKSGKPMMIKLSDEIIDAANGDGNAIKKKDVHKMADANKALLILSGN